MTINAWGSDDPAEIAKGGTGASAKTAAFDNLSPTTTKADIIVNDGTNNVRLAVGTDGHVLTADSTQTEGVKWAASGAGGTGNAVAYANIDYRNSVGSCTIYNDLNVASVSVTAVSGSDLTYTVTLDPGTISTTYPIIIANVMRVGAGNVYCSPSGTASGQVFTMNIQLIAASGVYVSFVVYE